MAAPKAKIAARTVAREEEAERMPERAPDRDNVIRNRKGEPVSLRFTGAEDKFAFDRSIIPQGWDYQWKTKTIKNWEWVDHQVELAQNGWEAVPADRHDGIFMPRGYKGNIERGGMILMERDERLTAQARRMDKRLADEPVHQSRSSAGLAGMLDRSAPNSGAIADFGHAEAQRNSGVKSDRQPRLPDRNYTYVVDE